MTELTADEERRFADRYLAECLHRESPPQVKELAAFRRMPRSEFSKQFSRLVGVSPSAYLRRAQIECAKLLLVEADLTMNEIAYKCGFGTRTTLFRAFKRFLDMTPFEFRTAYRRCP